MLISSAGCARIFPFVGVRGWERPWSREFDRLVWNFFLRGRVRVRPLIARMAGVGVFRDVFDQFSYEKDVFALVAKLIWSWTNFLLVRISSMVISALALPSQVASWRMISSLFPWLRGFIRKKIMT